MIILGVDSIIMMENGHRVLKIYIPNSFKSERSYITDVIFEEFLGLKCEQIFGDFRDYRISFEDKELIIKDAFFGVYDEYLSIDAIPKTVDFFEDLPIIYGENRIQNGYCGVDIFGSSFFMLSRFEEAVIKKRDEFDRFPSAESLSVKFGFEKKAVVNGYVELLWRLLLELGFLGDRKNREFKIIHTHDIDHIRFYKDFRFFSTRVKKCIFKYRNFPQAFREIRDFVSVKVGFKKDPFYTFERLMDISEQMKQRSIFYFLVGKNHSLDADFEIEDLKPIIKKIKNRGHKIGIHPSFLSFKDSGMIKKEIEILESFENIKIEDSRQHYLRFEVPSTWIALEASGIRLDSSLGFTDRVGFRCGACHPFSVYDIVNKRKLTLKEMPLIVMDGALKGESNSPQKAKKLLESLKNEVKKYNGELVILWHNSSFGKGWAEYVELYKDLID